MDLNNLKLEKFEVVGSKFSRKIGITRAASFGFPPVFLKENSLISVKYANLFYDRDNGVIGFRFTTDPEERSSFKLSFHQNGGASFGARSFFNAYKLDSNKINGRYEYQRKTVDGIGEVFLVEIKETEAKVIHVA